MEKLIVEVLLLINVAGGLLLTIRTKERAVKYFAGPLISAENIFILIYFLYITSH
ncbi:MAG: hypothetical protein K6T83_13775 [Alicyclobacillus sp.]|nr:hypothetical protein [Alicyclobacillus sp.]